LLFSSEVIVGRAFDPKSMPIEEKPRFVHSGNNISAMNSIMTIAENSKEGGGK
jgi:hypothetical protein